MLLLLQGAKVHGNESSIVLISVAVVRFLVYGTI